MIALLEVNLVPSQKTFETNGQLYKFTPQNPVINMKFGKVESADSINFDLPPIAAGTRQLLQKREQTDTPQIYIGCPIWGNKNWVGTLYPRKTPTGEYLKHYAQQFNTIELNSTHYSLPNNDTINKWKTQASPGFKFCPKVPQDISHKLMPAGKASDFTQVFAQTMEGLSDYLGTTFMQLSPYFSPQDVAHLQRYLANFPQHIPLAVEFRHADWFKAGHFENAAQLLEQHHVATVITDVAGRRDVLHQRLTTPTLVLRFVGNNLHPTDYTRIDAWVARIQELISLGLQSAYLFIHQPDENEATPELILYLIRALNKTCGLDLKAPQIYRPPVQGTLF
ncbi:protein of unknown function [Microscilla marina ATCC 23134]|uniref:DUF72 domain-containing protein n=2 Tax=Microscilla marina TaxID=1027 RepID=A1ZR05_MICM2|nr:protein of unknown function [Microscilla marina ATCC 23134]